MILMYPVRLLMHITIPDCRKDVFHNYYMLTFVMSTIWVRKNKTKRFFFYRLISGCWFGLFSCLARRYCWLYIKYSR